MKLPKAMAAKAARQRKRSEGNEGSVGCEGTEGSVGCEGSGSVAKETKAA